MVYTDHYPPFNFRSSIPFFDVFCDSSGNFGGSGLFGVMQGWESKYFGVQTFFIFEFLADNKVIGILIECITLSGISSSMLCYVIYL